MILTTIKKIIGMLFLKYLLFEGTTEKTLVISKQLHSHLKILFFATLKNKIAPVIC